MKVPAMKHLLILNDPPYGTERSYNGLRLAGALSKADGEETKLFLMGDAAACAKGGQKVAEGFYNIQIMLGRVVRNKAEVGVCGTCMDARGIADPDAEAPVRIAAQAGLTERLTADATRILDTSGAFDATRTQVYAAYREALAAEMEPRDELGPSLGTIPPRT